ncbi:MAG TPA: heavy-metal-associated domain-containing protein [Limnobacter sp.]|nr:heavy-metal-associated domain-containing protein [Limnobacter sp.]
MITLHVEKMKCGGCAANVKQAILNKDPQAEVETDLGQKKVSVESSLDGQTLADLISQAGYPASL